MELMLFGGVFFFDKLLKQLYVNLIFMIKTIRKMVNYYINVHISIIMFLSYERNHLKKKKKCFENIKIKLTCSKKLYSTS